MVTISVLRVTVVRDLAPRARLFMSIGLDWRVAFGVAGVFGLDAAPVENDAFADGDAIGLGAQRFAVGRRQLGPDTGGPAQSVQVVARRRDLHIPWI